MDDFKLAIYNRVKEEWETLCNSSLCLDQSIVQEWWDKIASLYSLPERHYHTLVHLAAMLKYKDECLSVIEDPTAIILATIFHE